MVINFFANNSPIPYVQQYLHGSLKSEENKIIHSPLAAVVASRQGENQNQK